jgi:hypothetical protein
MGKTVNLNKNASALMGEATKVRIRVLDGTLQVRPTDRKSAVGLPKGEMLAELRIKKQAVRALRFTIPSEVAEAANVGDGLQFLTVTGKHGWIALRAATADEVAFYNASRSATDGKQSGGSISSK